MRGQPILLMGALTIAPPTVQSCAEEAANAGPETIAAAASITPESTPPTDAWVEYDVTGDATVSGREEDVVMCAKTDPGFRARTLGDWFITIETERFAFGSLAAGFSVTAPAEVIPRTGGGVTNYRLEGAGHVTLADGGKNQMGMSLVTAEFTASGLVNGDDRTIDIRGRLSCALF